jgi:hypothetical protein
MKKYFCLAALIYLSLLTTAHAQNELGSVNFAIMAMDVDAPSRRLLEDAIVKRLRGNGYQVSESYRVIRSVNEADTRTVRVSLAEAGFDAVLIIRPVDIGRRATIESVQEFLSPGNYQTIAEFVENYRGANFNSRAVIHVVGFILDANRSLPVWQGVMWFDEETHSVEESTNKIVDLIEFNLNNYRASIRQQLGLPPLPITN